MRAVPMLLLVALAMSGCAAQAARDPVPADSSAAPGTSATAPSLDGTDWRFIDVSGSPVAAGVTATLRLRDGRASGRTGCNAYGASWTVSADGGTRFGAVMSTRMACLSPTGAMQVERGVLEALQHAARIQRNGDNLVLLDASGKPLAKLAPDAGPGHQ